MDAHHRQRRREGTHDLGNLVALHPRCHTIAPQAVHQRPAWARDRGLIVSAYADPTVAPLHLPDGRVVLLHPTAPIYIPAPPPS